MLHSRSIGSVLQHGRQGWLSHQEQAAYYILEVEDNKKEYFHSVLDKFIDEYLITPRPDDEDECSSPDDDNDFVRNYSLCVLKYFFIFLDIKDAVKEGNDERLDTLHKELLWHFKSGPGHNTHAIEMLISIVQNEVFLSEAEAHQSTWASTASWVGGPGKNIEIDILQECRNKDIKKKIKVMGANKTNKAIDRSSRSSGGERQTVDNFEKQVNRGVHSSSHTHRSSDTDESKLLADLPPLKPFSFEPNRKHDSFPDIMPDPLATLDELKYNKWVAQHKKNLLLDAPLGNDKEDEP